MDPDVPSGGQPPGWVPPPDATSAPAPQPAWQPPWPQQPPAWGQQAGGWPSYPPAYPPQGAWSAPAPGWAPPEKKKRFGWVAVILAFFIGGIVSFVITLGGIIAIGLALGTPDVIAGSHPAPAEGADVVKVGDCLRGAPGVASVVDRIDVVDCNEAHRTEVAAVVEVPGGASLPGDDDLQTYLDDACLLAFEGYVDTDYDTSMYEYAADAPSEEAWADGYRTAFCLVDTFGTPTGEGSVKGSGD